MRFILLAGVLLCAPLTAHACFVGTPEVFCDGGHQKPAKRATRRAVGGSMGIRSRAVLAALARVRHRCSGYRLISGYRNTYIAGTHRKSLHSYGLAADFKVNNYRCALGVLSRLSGIGYSGDPWRCHHIHVSAPGRTGRHEPRGFHHRYC